MQLFHKCRQCLLASDVNLKPCVKRIVKNVKHMKPRCR